MSETLTRTLSGLILAVLVFGALWWGGVASYALWAVVTVGVSVEWTRLVYKGINRSVARILFFSFGTLVYILSLLGFGLLIQPYLIICLLYFFVFVAAIDVGAYFIGRTFGGPKLAPSISPGKTWSGFVGGIVSGMLVSALLAIFVGGTLEARLYLPIWLPFALLGGVVAQLGDLYESKAKRFAGVKDSSHLIPGHGGILDRLDGLLALIPFSALYFIVMLYVYDWPEPFPQ